MSITIVSTNEIDNSYIDFETQQEISIIKYQVYFDWTDGIKKTQGGYFVALFDTNIDLENQCQDWIDNNNALDTAVLIPV